MVINISQYLNNKLKLSISYEIIERFEDLNLSVRESDCLFYMIRGKSSKAIASALKLSARTVEFAAIAGETYFIAVTSVPDSTFDLEIQKYNVDVGNIACATAFDLTPSLPYTAVVNTNGGFDP